MLIKAMLFSTVVSLPADYNNINELYFVSRDCEVEGESTWITYDWVGQENTFYTSHIKSKSVQW